MSRWTASSFGDLPPSPPKPKNLKSWWADPVVQNDREKFAAWARAEQDRIIGNQTFGGTKPTHDRFSQSAKRK